MEDIDGGLHPAVDGQSLDDDDDDELHACTVGSQLRRDGERGPLHWLANSPAAL